MDAMEHPNDCADCGSVSQGTLRGEDLLPLLVDVLSARLEASTFELGADDPSRVRRLGQVEGQLGEIERRMARLHYFVSEYAQDDLEWLQDVLNEYAPAGHWFGAHPSDGADFGYWPLEILE